MWKAWKVAKIISISLIVLVVSFFVYMIVGVFYFILGPIECGNEIDSEVTSSDGKYKVTHYTRNCGATTNFSDQVRIDEAQVKINLEDNKNIIFIKENDNDIKIEWEDKNTLAVYHDLKSDTSNRLERWNEISINYFYNENLLKATNSPIVLKMGLPRDSGITDRRTADEACLSLAGEIKILYSNLSCSLQNAKRLDGGNARMDTMIFGCRNGYSPTGCYACEFECDLIQKEDLDKFIN